MGKCDGPDFASAGGHFNPDAKKHGKDNPMGPHMGDLPNLTLRPTEKAKVNIVAMGVTLGDGPNSLFHDGGTALVIHAGCGRLQDRSLGKFRRTRCVRHRYKVKASGGAADAHPGNQDPVPSVEVVSGVFSSSRRFGAAKDASVRTCGRNAKQCNQQVLRMLPG